MRNYKPIKIRKNNVQKNMIHGNNLGLIIVLFFFYLFFSTLFAENKITSSPLINLMN